MELDDLPATVAEAMVTRPKVSGAGTTVRDARAFFADDHVHALLVVDAGGRVLAVVERPDLADAADDEAPAHRHGRLAGRVVLPGADPECARAELVAAGRRRLAVVDGSGVLLGLLCLKRSGRGFCSDAGVASRAADRA